MRRVWITDAEVVCSLGGNLASAWKALVSGERGGRKVTLFPTENYASDTAALVPDLPAGPGRMNALLERLLGSLERVPTDARLVTATTKGGIDHLEGLLREGRGDAGALPLPALSEAVAERLSLSAGRAMNVSAACASSTIALGRGAAMIASGRCDAVLVCAADIVTEFVFSGFSALGALGPGASRPFDRERAGLMLGEGASALLLVAEERARREGRRCLGILSGWGEAADAAHVTAPARDGRGLVRAVERALTKAAISPEEVAGIIAHGTGTRYNDAMELTAFGRVFSEKPVKVASVKGATGHTLGAAGAIEAAFGLRALAEGVLPPTAGLVEPEAAGEGIVDSRPAPLGEGRLLSTNSGFGGINAAVILERGTE